MILTEKKEYAFYKNAFPELKEKRKPWDLLDCCFDSPIAQAKFIINRRDNPTSAAVLMGDFIFCFGTADENFLSEAVAGRESLILMTPKNGWGQAAKQLFCKSREYLRYSFSLSLRSGNYKTDKKSLPTGTELVPIEESWFYQCRKEEWMQDFCSQFKSFSEYQQYGMGFLLLKDGKPVSGASSYLVSRSGFTIQVQTKEEEQGKGYAFYVCRALISYALKEGKYPDWDADNETSARLAQRLGYNLEKSYPVMLVQR